MNEEDKKLLFYILEMRSALDELKGEVEILKRMVNLPEHQYKFPGRGRPKVTNNQ